MVNSDQLTIKKQLLEKCFEIQTKLASVAQEAMRLAQESANEVENSTEEMTDSFREQCQTDRNMYARQLEERMAAFSILKLIEPAKMYNTVQLGSVVITNQMNFFVSASIGEIEVEDGKFFAISTQSPLYQAMNGKSAGESFKFRNILYSIKEVF